MIPWDDLDFMVSFKKIETGVKEQYKFGLNNDGNGLLTYGTEDGDHFFKEGTYTFTVKANEGYELDKIYNQDGVDVTADINLDGNGNFEWRVAYDGYLTATFKEVRHHNGYRWGLQSDGNGVVRCDELGYDGGEKFVEENEYTFAVIPNEGYKLDKLYLLTEGTEADVTADAKIAEDGTFTWTVAYDGTLKAVFAKIEPVVEPETPVVEPETPVVEPETPVVEPETPVVEPETPVVEPETPVVEPETPVVEPETPVVKPETPEKPEEPQIKPDNKTNSTDKNTKQTTVDKKVDNTPKTGDTTPIAAVAFISVIALAAAVAAFLSFYLRREK